MTQATLETTRNLERGQVVLGKAECAESASIALHLLPMRQITPNARRKSFSVFEALLGSVVLA